MKRRRVPPAFIAHGGAGRPAPASEMPGRRQGLIAAAEAAAKILQEDGDALDAVVAAVVRLEDDPLFNAGYGSYLTTAGTVEMDAAVAVARRRGNEAGGYTIHAGGVVTVRRVRNPIMLARVVMERTPHLLIGGVGAERIAREAGMRLCRPEAMIAPRSRERWMALGRGKRTSITNHGTVGAVALDIHGNLAAATSTGGVTLKLPGRIGDSAILGAGLHATGWGAASATGEGEAILKSALCRDAVDVMRRNPPPDALALAIRHLAKLTAGEAGLIAIDARGRFGYAHNARAMEIATYRPDEEVRHRSLPGLGQDD